MIQAGVPLFTEAASSVANHVDNLYLFLNLMTAFFTLLIAGLVIYFAIKYRRRSEDEVPPEIESNFMLEVAWIAIPMLLMIVPFVWGVSIYFKIARPPADAMDIYVI